MAVLEARSVLERQAGPGGPCGRVRAVVGVDRVGQAEALRDHGADLVVADLAAMLDKP